MDFQKEDQIVVTVHVPEGMLPSEAYAQNGARKTLLRLAPRLIDTFVKGFLFLVRMASAETTNSRSDTYVRRVEEVNSQVIIDIRLDNLEQENEEPSQPKALMVIQDEPANPTPTKPKDDAFKDFLNELGPLLDTLDEDY